ncbi:MAG: UDP-N-acetylglucosamine 2-epimerase (non-hydrolyzing) [Elusimicrobiaceae bacterium]|jgi:UDP-N-acetylglucosamine 2-epimerase (non-hydrolysing)|nr:UDP-N-acetylglucosamine 2-epimerase (non-hydrolyzing) [Elusimicrobiaceae bacterium]MBT3955522.1 UDP-N-acetylglucosamine 2-epimerase (non-hydrolyzing) [Elusimicrobiaceae bacterium]MBT4008149.1 UDP-N-acetylglucosamine 2-epimerase (non-hydrolyzing) [Elusimicrobiaceae bacterium]MBT4402551.1 UDP-N-acetylglucosamine 2-epimerase (non-hydrolyzing) [Elusimicrobiaceae bacterium]MBT4439678.1 UDP-N-acetylglucosamine 2-epimerase (non-hydrolyzing) [Elusimicrobiaceae bacterium]
MTKRVNKNTNKKKKILLVFGTRPEAIKFIPLYHELKKYPKQFDVKICTTAQHRHMLDQVMTFFDVKSDVDLNVMKEGQSFYQLNCSIIYGIKKVLQLNKPDLVIVQGDTTTTFVSSLASFYERIDVAHLEAGLRTHDIYSPWPEEANRQLTGRIAKFHLAPTQHNKYHLQKENIPTKHIAVVGNTVIDALFMTLDKIKKSKKLEIQILKQLESEGFVPNDRKFILVTAHRRESFGEGFEGICKGIAKIAKAYPEIDIVYPVHLNPKVRKPVGKYLSNKKNIFLIEPLDYKSFIYMMDKSYFVMSDSGGVQEEAPSLGKPVLVLREKTERVEAIFVGTVKLVGTNADRIFREAKKLLTNKTAYKKMAELKNPYGNGDASKKIVKFLSKYYEKKRNKKIKK